MKNVNNAWLKPTGQIIFKHPKFYNELGGWHLQLGMVLLEDLWKTDFLGVMDRLHKKWDHNSMDELEDKGWIRLHGFGGITPVWIIPPRKKLTKKQEETILDWCIANDRNYDTCFVK